MNFLSSQWQKLPLWVKQTTLEVVETAFVALLAYFVGVFSGDRSFDLNILMVVVFKAVAKVLRANPKIPVDDYVNNHF